MYLVLIYLRQPIAPSEVYPRSSLLGKSEDRVNIKYSIRRVLKELKVKTARTLLRIFFFKLPSIVRDVGINYDLTSEY